MKKPLIEFKNFSFKYRSQAKPTLHNINLTIYQGEKVLIVGPSGSGKSTIGHCINGLIPFSYKGEVEGSLKIAGEETKDTSIFDLSKKVGTVLQDPDGQFIGLTVGEDIAFALENDCVAQNEMIDIVKDTAHLVEMDHFLNQSVQALSGGQKQRVSLAGVMVDKVDILLFDEPLANLDPRTGKYTISLIDKIQKQTNTTVVIIEHRLEDVLYREVDRIVVVYDGEIVADMKPNELLATNLLTDCDVREPLYLKAAKFAGCKITEEMMPASVQTFNIDECKPSLIKWYKETLKSPFQEDLKPLLEVKDLSFSYFKEQPTIKEISFTVHKGEMISIVGKNGAGKSTLTKLITGFEKPTSGQVLLNGQDITNETIKERSFKIGLVLQNPNHMISKHLIFDEVALGLTVRGIPVEEVKERVEKTLKICGLYPFRNWPISALSFGQKKRVTIASILVLEPEVIILDEPTAGQDYRHYTEIMEFLVELNRQGVTIVMITHDMHLMLEYTTRAIVIADGEKIADARAVDVLTDSSIIEKANLKETSLFELAERLGIQEPTKFVDAFITHEREVLRNGS